MSEAYLTVEALTKYIKRKFDADPYLKKVYVKGELSNVKHHTSGHLYFTLKDHQAQIRGMMYKRDCAQLKFKAEDGLNVLMEGYVSLYERGGTYQFYATNIEPDGVGSLYLAFEQLKAQLTEEGLFDERFKQPIPSYPTAIGVVTATTGAAIRDICTTLKRHYPLADVYIFPTLVQGERAAASIVNSIRQANALGGIDTLIVGRGGGSIEDLWAFNEEIVARAIFESRIPIISGVGHETDTTIADFAADLRAPTPTGAAKMAVPDVLALRQRVTSYESRIMHMASMQLDRAKQRLQHIMHATPMQFPERLYRPFEERLVRLEDQLQQAAEQQLVQKTQQLERLTARLAQQMPLAKVRFEGQHVTNLSGRLQRAMRKTIDQKAQQFDSTLRTLAALNPLSVMERGYSIVYNKERQVVMSAERIVPDEPITIHVADGKIEATVTAVQKEE